MGTSKSVKGKDIFKVCADAFCFAPDFPALLRLGNIYKNMMQKYANCH